MSVSPQNPKVLAECPLCAKRCRVPNDGGEYACAVCGSILAVVSPSEPPDVDASGLSTGKARPASTVRILQIRHLPFWSLADFGAKTGIAAGVITGPIVLIASLLGGEIKMKILFFEVGGVLGGIVGLVWIPLFFGMIACAIAALAYLPLKWWMTRGPGLRLRVMMDAPRGTSPVSD